MRVCVFIIFGKNAGSISACLNVLQKVVSQQSELCVFRCAASAAHFLFAAEQNCKQCEKKDSSNPKSLSGEKRRKK